MNAIDAKILIGLLGSSVPGGPPTTIDRSKYLSMLASGPISVTTRDIPGRIYAVVRASVGLPDASKTKVRPRP